MPDVFDLKYRWLVSAVFGCTRYIEIRLVVSLLAQPYSLDIPTDAQNCPLADAKVVIMHKESCSVKTKKDQCFICFLTTRQCVAFQCVVGF